MKGLVTSQKGMSINARLTYGPLKLDSDAALSPLPSSPSRHDDAYCSVHHIMTTELSDSVG